MPAHPDSAMLERGPLTVPPLDTRVVGSKVLLYSEAPSTNDLAARIGGDGTVVVADAQTAGRGRHGRSWHSAAGLGLWFSVAFRGKLHGLAFAAMLAVRGALGAKCAIEVKWPNDLLLAGRKVCGILVEERPGLSIAGIGINVHHKLEDFPAELRESAGSLEQLTGTPWDRAELLGQILTNLDERAIVLRQGGYSAVLDEWTGACGLAGRRVRIGACEGVVLRLDELGALVIDTPEGVKRVVSGDVHPLPDGPGGADAGLCG